MNGSDMAISVTRRISMVSALLLALLLIGLPAGMSPGRTDANLDLVGQASASGPGDRTLTVGILNLQGSLGTLNPLFYNHEYEGFVFWPCYSTLLGYDINRKYIGDLATWWEVSPNGTLYHFKITSYARFYDRLHPDVVHPLTVYDIMYTYYLCQNNTNNMRFYFPVIGNQRVISNMWAVNDYEFYIQTVAPFAPMLNSLATVPILPQYLWSTQKINWPNYDSSAGIPPIVGSGAWYYALDGLPTTGVVELRRSPTWFAIEERGWQLRPSKLIYKSETSVDTSLNDLRTGVIDIQRFPSSAQFLNTLPGMPEVTRWAVPSAYVYEYCFNQMTNTQRSDLGGRYNQGSNNQLLLDPVVKRALLMALNRQGFVDGILDGLGAPATSFISPLNPYHYDYGSRPGETPIPFDPAAARTFLNANDWKYDLNGVENPNATPLCKPGGQDPLRFRFYTPNDRPQWDPGARMIANWSWLAGIDLKTLYRSESQTFMNNAWFNADFDIWLWEWAFGTTSEASTDIMVVLTTDSIGSWSCSYWSNATYDDLYNQSLLATDYETRYEILADMQALHYFESGDYALAYASDLWAATNGGPDHWTNWGNWVQQSILTPDSTTAWLYMQITPDETLGQNPAPRITSMQPYYDAEMNVGLDLMASATDNGPLVYRWFFGDGQKTGWLANPSVNHAYTKDGIYTAWLAVRESASADNFTALASTEVRVFDMSNYAPTGVDFTFSPIDPDSGNVVYLNATATDPNGDPMTFAWDFGDGHMATGQSVTHQFTSGLPSYTVLLSVDDGHLGMGTRPVNASHLLPVTPNSPPTCSVPSYPHVVWKTLTNFTITSSDDDARDKPRYTWDWGDGSMSVTTTKWALHSYSRKASYTLTVYADDLTGLPDHNVSGSNNVLVTGTNVVPSLVGFTVDNSSPNVCQVVTFTGSATDADSDMLYYTFDFGDGSLGYASGISSPTVPLVLDVSYWYSAPGFYTAYLYVTDGYSVPLTSSPIVMNVVFANHPPVVTPLADIQMTSGYAATFSVSASDPDGDPLKYTWDFGDLSPLVVGNNVQHTYSYEGDFVYRVYVDDGTGFVGYNVSESAWARINDFTLTLVKGWNFVTVPLVGYGYKASNLPGLAMMDSISRWNAATQTYDKTYIKGVTPPSGDFTLDPSCGYWINVGANRTVGPILGEIPAGPQTRAVTLPGATGWINLGFCTLNETWKASKVVAMYSGTVQSLSWYNPVTKMYKTYIKGVPPSDFTLTPGQAYWVSVSGGGTFTYTP